MKGEGQRIMARLDKDYISSYLAQNQANNIFNCVVKGDRIKSNHHPISCVVELLEILAMVSFWKMYVTYCKEVKD